MDRRALGSIDFSTGRSYALVRYLRRRPLALEGRPLVPGRTGPRVGRGRGLVHVVRTVRSTLDERQPWSFAGIPGGSQCAGRRQHRTGQCLVADRRRRDAGVGNQRRRPAGLSPRSAGLVLVSHGTRPGRLRSGLHQPFRTRGAAVHRIRERCRPTPGAQRTGGRAADRCPRPGDSLQRASVRECAAAALQVQACRCRRTVDRGRWQPDRPVPGGPGGALPLRSPAGGGRRALAELDAFDGTGGTRAGLSDQAAPADPGHCRPAGRAACFPLANFGAAPARRRAQSHHRRANARTQENEFTPGRAFAYRRVDRNSESPALALLHGRAVARVPRGRAALDCNHHRRR